MFSRKRNTMFDNVLLSHFHKSTEFSFVVKMADTQPIVKSERIAKGWKVNREWGVFEYSCEFSPLPQCPCSTSLFLFKVQIFKIFLLTLDWTFSKECAFRKLHTSYNQKSELCQSTKPRSLPDALLPHSSGCRVLVELTVISLLFQSSPSVSGLRWGKPPFTNFLRTVSVFTVYFRS